MIRAFQCIAALAGVLLFALPANAQRVFVSGSGLDTNPCTFAQPCRTFQQAFNTAPANGEIDVLDAAGYGPLTITHGISIQAHGFGGITQTNGNFPAAGVTVNVATSDPVTLNGLLIDGTGVGYSGIYIAAGHSVPILNCVVRHFQFGIVGLIATNSAKVLIEDTVSSDNVNDGFTVEPGGINITGFTATYNRITANNNQHGVTTGVGGTSMITNSVMSNNSYEGLRNASGGIVYLTKSAISGNGWGVVNVGTVISYGDNAIVGNINNNESGSQPVAKVLAED